MGVKSALPDLQPCDKQWACSYYIHEFLLCSVLTGKAYKVTIDQVKAYNNSYFSQKPRINVQPHCSLWRGSWYKRAPTGSAASRGFCGKVRSLVWVSQLGWDCVIALWGCLPCRPPALHQQPVSGASGPQMYQHLSQPQWGGQVLSWSPSLTGYPILQHIQPTHSSPLHHKNTHTLGDIISKNKVKLQVKKWLKAACLHCTLYKWIHPTYTVVYTHVCVQVVIYSLYMNQQQCIDLDKQFR